MKIKIKIPLNSSWPSQFYGQTVAVEICNVKFPDGLYWACEGFVCEVPVDSGSNQFFHDLPSHTKKVSVEYFTPKEMQS